MGSCGGGGTGGALAVGMAAAQGLAAASHQQLGQQRCGLCSLLCLHARAGCASCCPLCLCACLRRVPPAAVSGCEVAACFDRPPHSLQAHPLAQAPEACGAHMIGFVRRKLALAHAQEEVRAGCAEYHKVHTT